MKFDSKHIARMRKRIPFFPIIPFVPLSLVLANALAIGRLWRRVHRLEQHEHAVV
jgi:hypothetical protein